MDAKKELDRLEREVQAIGEFYLEVGKGLSVSPPRLMLANSGLSTRTGLDDARMVDFTKWPEKDTVKEKLAEFYEAETAYAQAYRYVPAEERDGFPKPNP